jgi:L-ascorbate metabolism protein UlaG (beta-lactamase superfamily)
MKRKMIILLVVGLSIVSLYVQGQSKVELMVNHQGKVQAKAPPTQKFGRAAFAVSDGTTLRWLGMAGWFINSRGTNLMIDPLLKGFDMDVMIKFPIKSTSVPSLDAVLITHADNDHFSIPTTKDLLKITKSFHSTKYVDSLMGNLGYPSFGHDIGTGFSIGQLRVRLTPADHAYQNAYPKPGQRYFKNEDACGFWIDTPDGSIWATGDSRLLPEHLNMKTPDAILFDFSDSEWHFTLQGAVKLANAYPDTPLLLSHWGSVNAPDFAPFNGNPNDLYKLIVNPGRIKVLAPGEPYILKPLKSNIEVLH